nr:MAG TPA: hypothetical protein [Caudoviricetes sp.]
MGMEDFARARHYSSIFRTNVPQLFLWVSN